MATIYVTAPREAAEDIARQVVEERLAACVNIVDCRSIFRWEHEVHDEAEAILFAKTNGSTAEALMARLNELHPHDVPCIERFEESRVAGQFADWRRDVIGGSA